MCTIYRLSNGVSVDSLLFYIANGSGLFWKFITVSAVGYMEEYRVYMLLKQ
jgi:hypothetical protein